MSFFIDLGHCVSMDVQGATDDFSRLEFRTHMSPNLKGTNIVSNVLRLAQDLLDLHDSPLESADRRRQFGQYNPFGPRRLRTVFAGSQHHAVAAYFLIVKCNSSALGETVAVQKWVTAAALKMSSCMVEVQKSWSLRFCQVSLFGGASEHPTAFTFSGLSTIRLE
ncbi:hypothetical protein [Caballeronia sp. dw_276]|uniref:hypothetical protein n=1 Tax=Caballeronia sp. dw_276 TaxID=2719795 RepID=UPI001BD527E3|nr:hypothetical protein [Caballeronia sp. dw_276]